MLLRPVQRQIEFGQPGRGEFDGLPALQNRLDQLSALVEGICEDAVDAGEKMTLHRTARRDDLLSADGHAAGDLHQVDNAIKYGGTAAVTLASGADRVVILVEDEGFGIPRSEREKVFEPFYRIGSARDPGTGGIGLGLFRHSLDCLGTWQGHHSRCSQGRGPSVRVEPPSGLRRSASGRQELAESPVQAGIDD